MILHVKCIEAKDVPKMDVIGESDPYLVLKTNKSNQEYKTAYVRDTKNPVWNEKFSIQITSSMDEILTVTMYDKDLMKDDIISHCIIQVNQLQIGKITDNWFEMTSDCKKYPKGGTVRLMLHLARHGAEPFKET